MYMDYILKTDEIYECLFKPYKDSEIYLKLDYNQKQLIQNVLESYEKSYMLFRCLFLNKRCEDFITISSVKKFFKNLKFDDDYYNLITTPYKNFPRLIYKSNELKLLLGFKVIGKTKYISKTRLESFNFRKFDYLITKYEKRHSNYDKYKIYEKHK